jgi:hypothetical protein
MKTLRTLGTLAIAGSVLSFIPVGSAMAAPGDTDTTFTLTGGSLEVTTMGSRTLDAGAPGDASVSGSLGPVSISDTRGSTAGWVLSAKSTTFTDGAGSDATGVSYASGAATGKTGIVTPTTAGLTSIMGAVEVPVAAGTAASGNNTASFDPTLTVHLPASALAGDYEGIVTTSVA